MSPVHTSTVQTGAEPVRERSSPAGRSSLLAHVLSKHEQVHKADYGVLIYRSAFTLELMAKMSVMVTSSASVNGINENMYDLLLLKLGLELLSVVFHPVMVVRYSLFQCYLRGFQHLRRSRTKLLS